MVILYADHDVAEQVAQLLRQAGHLVTTTRSLFQTRTNDAARLLLAQQHSWIMITHNYRDYLLLHQF